jgi:hypothetical protein
MSAVNLRNLVEEIRRELEAVDRDREARNAEALFELQGMDLELKFTLSEATTGKAGLDLKLITAGNETQVRSETVHTVKISYRVNAQYRGAGRRAHSSAASDRPEDKGVQPLK